MTQLSREYKNSAVARREIQKMGRLGYTVISMTEVQQRSGIGRFLLLGIFAAVFHPKPRVLVVYQSDGADVAVPTMAERMSDAKATTEATVETIRNAYNWAVDKYKASRGDKTA